MIANGQTFTVYCHTNIALAQRGRFSDPAQRGAVSERLKALWADPVYRANILKSRKEARHADR